MPGSDQTGCAQYHEYKSIVYGVLVLVCMQSLLVVYIYYVHTYIVVGINDVVAAENRANAIDRSTLLEKI